MDPREDGNFASDAPGEDSAVLKESGSGPSSGLPAPGPDAARKRARFQAIFRFIVLVLGFLVVDFLATGVHSVREFEQGIVLRFGAVERRVLPGLVFTWPWPIERLEKVNTQATRKMPVGFRMRLGADPSPPASVEREWLTGDMNIIDLEMMIHYRVSDPERYLFGIGPPPAADFLVRKCAESVLTERVGIRAVDALLTTEKSVVERETLTRTQALLDRYGAGLVLSRANLRRIAPPEDAKVSSAFKDVSSAKADMERASQEADAYRRDLLPGARARATEVEQKALAYKSRVLSRARGGAERFRSMVEAYRLAPKITRRRLFLEMAEEALSRPKKVLLTRDAEGRGRVEVIR